MLRGPRRRAIAAGVDAAVKTGARVDFAHGSGLRVVAEPVITPIERVAGVRAVAVPALEAGGDLPEPGPMGGFSWDLDNARAYLTSEVYDIRGIPADERRGVMTTSEMLACVSTSSLQHSSALATAMVGEHGDVVDDVWQIKRDSDGIMRDILLSGTIEVTAEKRRWLHGVVCDLTVGDEAVPPPLSFADSLVAAELAVQAGKSALIMNPKRLLAVQWLTPPPEGIQYTYAGDPDRDPAIHPDDFDRIVEIFRNLTSTPVEADVRVRGVDGGWVWLHGSAVLMNLDNERPVRGALVKLERIPPPG
ncbi:hypothetical protein ACT17_15265 [Mycolicibacterium conceptionense]|uniref:PAS fold-3 domain-containing protein n=1 Tax=Mycolicibacterium conceptionense TaxID=451644 RepID=A0A0J8U9E9_9MYCO|nr:PAS domain-containing protein [Mycolicibacterium conceptionense]KMV17637.1 hypothetical protein ACT17_15265 [Mycolicibacterium conceptionense]